MNMRQQNAEDADDRPHSFFFATNDVQQQQNVISQLTATEYCGTSAVGGSGMPPRDCHHRRRGNTRSKLVKLIQSTFGFDSLQSSALEDFYRLVDRPRNPNACWLWKGRSLTGDGYGQIMRGHKRYMTHRYSYLLHYGYLPDDKKVCHTCDTPACVNPRHLVLGTQRENMHDRDRKGRGNNFRQKLTDEQVQEIRDLSAEGVPQSVLAQRFGVRQPTISYIERGLIRTGRKPGRQRQ